MRRRGLHDEVMLREGQTGSAHLADELGGPRHLDAAVLIGDEHVVDQTCTGARCEVGTLAKPWKPREQARSQT